MSGTLRSVSPFSCEDRQENKRLAHVCGFSSISAARVSRRLGSCGELERRRRPRSYRFRGRGRTADRRTTLAETMPYIVHVVPLRVASGGLCRPGSFYYVLAWCPH